MNNQLIYFCKGLKCNGEILFALKHCAFPLPNKAIAADQRAFIEHIGRFCKTWDLSGSWDYSTGMFVREYCGKTHNGYNFKVKWPPNTLEIIISTNDRIVLLYDFQFESETFTHSVLYYWSSYEMIEIQSKRFEYANDLKKMLLGDLNKRSKAQ